MKLAPRKKSKRFHVILHMNYIHLLVSFFYSFLSFYNPFPEFS
jgi:hypothetical protein